LEQPWRTSAGAFLYLEGIADSEDLPRSSVVADVNGRVQLVAQISHWTSAFSSCVISSLSRAILCCLATISSICILVSLSSDRTVAVRDCRSSSRRFLGRPGCFSITHLSFVLSLSFNYPMHSPVICITPKIDQCAPSVKPETSIDYESRHKRTKPPESQGFRGL
jgi:hypothetical protein